MATIVSPRWRENICSTLNVAGQIDEVISYNPASQWLIEELTRRQKLFKVYSLGAGVKRITTETDTCPCCKRKL